MMTAFGLNIDQAQWLITAYMIASAVLIPTWLVGSRLGNRNLFVLSLLIFVGSSVLCGLAWSGPTLILFWVLQGIGGGPITPMVMVFLAAGVSGTAAWSGDGDRPPARPWPSDGGQWGLCSQGM